MVQMKLACKVCGTLLNNEKDVMMHYFTKHKGIEHYAVPVFTGELPIPIKGAPKPKKKVRKEEPEEEEDITDAGYEEGLDDDLSLD